MYPNGNIVVKARTPFEELARATGYKAGDTGTRDSPLYRSPARELLDRIGTHDIEPAGRGRRVSAPPSLVLPAGGTGNAIPVTAVMDIGRRVREARLGMGMTQQRFADMAGVGRRFLIELEHGKASLEIGRVLAVCHAAGIKLGFLA